jgi:leucyl aminopeptidase
LAELLPAERDTRLLHRRAQLDSRTLERHDAAVIVCDLDGAAAALEKLPFAALWRELYRAAQKRGPVTVLSARTPSSAKPVVVAFVKSTASAFERLTLAAKAWKELGSAPEGADVCLACPGMNARQELQTLEALVAAALAATAPMPTFKTKSPRTVGPRSLVLIGSGTGPDLVRARAIDRGNHLARWLTTLPPNVLDSSGYRRAIKELARKHGWVFTFFDESALRRLKAGAFLAVARANDHRDAGIVRLRYRSSRGSSPRRHIALVGKGICFDTGGINLKAHKGMYLMHEDMQGSAVALGTLLALSELEVPYDIDCWLAITENHIGPRAFRPQEVVRAANGVSIHVAHSDAEGRMVLADTLALASREKPDLIVDYATLTGACVTALTERYSGAFTNRADWNAILEAAGRESGERVWPFPMDEDYDGDLESGIADVLQCTPDSKGDHILAARFLSRFVPQEIPWIHLDLASSNRTGGLAHVPTDFTGFGVRYSVQLLRDRGLLDGSDRRRASMAAISPACCPSRLDSSRGRSSCRT